jgi:hypothetical protein
MDKNRTPKWAKMFITLALIMITAVACNASLSKEKEPELAETVSVQSTWIAHLSTQVEKQEQVNFSQWEAIGRLYTQMPYALGIITPVPPGVTITLTSTPFSDQAPEKNYTPTPSASIDIEYPPDIRTGIDEIDNVIDAIMGNDIDTRLGLVRLISTACTTADGLGGPPKCQTGEVDGTIIEAFPVSNGEGHHVRPEKIQNAFDFTVRGLVAIYVVPEKNGQAEQEYWPAGEYGIIFSSEDGDIPHIIIVLVENGHIVRLGFNPSWPPFDTIRQKSDEFILSPIR